MREEEIFAQKHAFISHPCILEKILNQSIGRWSWDRSDGLPLISQMRDFKEEWLNVLHTFRGSQGF